MKKNKISGEDQVMQVPAWIEKMSDAELDIYIDLLKEKAKRRKKKKYQKKTLM